MAQSRLRQALPGLITLRRPLSPSPLLKPSISSSISLSSSQQQQDACSFLTSLVQSRGCASYPTVSANKDADACPSYRTVSENKVADFRWCKRGDQTTIEVVFENCDYNHWLIAMRFGDPQPTQEEMIRTYEETCAKVLDISLEEAKQRIYACATSTFRGFQAKMSKEESEKFNGAPGVAFVFPDLYVEPKYQKFGGDPYINGTITPRPAEHWQRFNQEEGLADYWPRYNPIKNQMQCEQNNSRTQDAPDKANKLFAEILNKVWKDDAAENAAEAEEDLNNIWPEDAVDNLNHTPPARGSNGQGPK